MAARRHKPSWAGPAGVCMDQPRVHRLHPLGQAGRGRGDALGGRGDQEVPSEHTIARNALQRVRMADGLPMMCELRYVASGLCPGLEKHGLVGSWYNRCEQTYGLQLAGVNQRLSALEAPGALIEVFNWARPVPACRVEGGCVLRQGSGAGEGEFALPGRQVSRYSEGDAIESALGPDNDNVYQRA